MQVIPTRVLTSSVQLSGAGAISITPATITVLRATLVLAGVGNLFIEIGQTPGHITIGPPHRKPVQLTGTGSGVITVGTPRHATPRTVSRGRERITLSGPDKSGIRLG
jgi:hypothetical protein